MIWFSGLLCINEPHCLLLTLTCSVPSMIRRLCSPATTCENHMVIISLGSIHNLFSEVLVMIKYAEVTNLTSDLFELISLKFWRLLKHDFPPFSSLHLSDVRKFITAASARQDVSLKRKRTKEGKEISFIFRLWRGNYAPNWREDEGVSADMQKMVLQIRTWWLPV